LLTVCFTLKDIAEYIGVHYTAVSRVVKKIERGKMKCDIARPDPIILGFFCFFNEVCLFWE